MTIDTIRGLFLFLVIAGGTAIAVTVWLGRRSRR